MIEHEAVCWLLCTYAGAWGRLRMAIILNWQLGLPRLVCPSSGTVITPVTSGLAVCWADRRVSRSVQRISGGAFQMRSGCVPDRSQSRLQVKIFSTRTHLAVNGKSIATGWRQLLVEQGAAGGNAFMPQSSARLTWWLIQPQSHRRFVLHAPPVRSLPFQTSLWRPSEALGQTQSSSGAVGCRSLAKRSAAH